MALHWSLGDVADHKTACFEEAEHDAPMRGVKKGDRIMKAVTNTLIWATIPIGMGSITAENAETFALRLRAYENAFGAFLDQPVDKDGKPATKDDEVVKYVARRITLDEVKAHVGLGTNASRLTDAKFKADLVARILREAAESIRYEKRAAAEAAAAA